MGKMCFIVGLINDSNVLNNMEDFDEMTPEEYYEKDGESKLYDIIRPCIKVFTKLGRMYVGNYDFTNEDLLFLINQLNFIDNKYLIDMIIFAKYNESEFISINLNSDLLRIYREEVDKNIFWEFIERKNINILKWIYKNYKTAFSEEILKYCCQFGNIIINKEMLKYCCKFGNVEIWEWLLSLCGRINEEDFLIISAMFGNIEMLKYFLNKGTDLHFNDDESLRLAAKNGHTEIVRLLLDRKANIHADDDYALRLSILYNHIKIVKLLLDRGADMHAYNND